MAAFCRKPLRQVFAVRQMTGDRPQVVAVCKDFQRAKAASLVPANRNCSVGDSTWPSQKTTLALPAGCNSASPIQGRNICRKNPVNYQAPSGTTSCSPAKDMPLLSELFCLAGAILQICRAAGAGEKLQRTGALQDASRLIGLWIFAPASWIAVALHRFGITATIFHGAANVGGRPQGLPARQGRVAGVFKQKFQRRRFDVAVAKDHVGFGLR